jgi:hypothetical protein
MNEQHDPTWDPYRSLLRLAGGAVVIAADRVREIEHRLGSGMDEAVADGGFRGDMESLVALAMGLASEAPATVAVVVDGVGRATRPAVRIGRPFVSALSGTLLGRLAGSLGGMTAQEAGRLAALGRAEIARGRMLVTEVYNQSVDGILGNLGESEVLGELVADQALGVTRGAVQEVRETSAAADWLTESIFRRVAGRSRRALPPKPAGAT